MWGHNVVIFRLYYRALVTCDDNIIIFFLNVNEKKKFPYSWIIIVQEKRICHNTIVIT